MEKYIIKGLDKGKFETLVLLPYEGKLCGEFKNNNIDYIVCDLPVIRRSMFTPVGIFKFLIQNIKFFIFLSKLVKREKIDIIHTNTSAVWMGGFIAKTHGKKHVWQVMELVEKPKAISILIRKIVGIFSSKVFTISKAVKDFFLVYNKSRSDKFEVLYHGVDLKVYDPDNNNAASVRSKLNIAPETIIVGMAGRINGWKGHDVFVKSIPSVLKKLSPDVKLKFLILGDTFQGQEHFEEDLKEIIASSSVGDSLIMLGFQSDFQDWLAAMDIFILPSTLPEPNATVTLAAMAMRKPMIATNIGGTVETVIENETGFLIPPNDPESLADRILYFVSNREKIAQLGANGYSRAQQYFSMENYGRVISNEYLRD